MADIKQAAKWMQEGRTVRRAEWRELNPNLSIGSIPVEMVFPEAAAGYAANTNLVVNARVPARISFTTQALLADDWEIAE